MTDAIEGTPEVDRADIYALIVGLTPGTKYLASDLFKRYAALARQAGRVPASPNAVGRMLRRVGCDRRKTGTGKAARAAWLITGEASLNADLEVRRAHGGTSGKVGA